MDSGVVVALIAAIGSLLATAAKIIWDALEKHRERKSAERAELRRYRSLLLRAADELGSRIGNIRFGSFFAEDAAPDNVRRPVAIQSTSFRFGQYFTWAEIYREYLRLNPDKVSRLKADTEAISDKLDEISSKFASDSPLIGGPLLMLWREEQSAIADSMRKPGSPTECIGFSSFANDYKAHHAKRFERFERDLESIFWPPVKGADNKRLADVTAHLVELIVLLDVERAFLEYENGQPVPPRWSRPDAPHAVLPQRTR